VQVKFFWQRLVPCHLRVCFDSAQAAIHLSRFVSARPMPAHIWRERGCWPWHFDFKWH
jgi:hypothetical protein